MGKFSTDTFYATTKSLHGHKASQIYSHKAGFVAIYDIIKDDGPTVGQTLNDFIHEWGIPDTLVFDGAKVQTGQNTLFMKIVWEVNINYHVSEPRRPDQNPSEAAIREVKKRLYRLMLKKRVPRRLWNFALRWICETGNVTVTRSHYAQGRTPLEIITGRHLTSPSSLTSGSTIGSPSSPMVVLVAQKLEDGWVCPIESAP